MIGSGDGFAINKQPPLSVAVYGDGSDVA